MQNRNQQISALIELNEELENYFVNTIIPQLFVDANLKLRKFTPPAAKQFRLKEDFIGMSIEEIQENFQYPAIIANIKVVITTGRIFEREIQTTDNRWFQMNILPYRVRNQKETNGVIMTFVDITARVCDLKEQQKLISEHELLLYTLGHDLKNSILGLALTIQMLKKQPEISMQKFSVLLNNVETGLTSMKKVISDLIDSRWTKEQHQASEELLDVGNILEDVRLTLAKPIQESGAVIKHDIEYPEVKFVRRKLRTVMYNLLSNAIKYTPVGLTPQLEIKCAVEGQYVVISVSDNGIGMSSQEQKLIFNKFYQTRTESEGSGIGLYLVNTIVTNSGGKIELDSKPGEGSVFRVYLKTEGN